MLAWCEDYAAALKLFEAGDFPAAEAEWARLAELDWPGAGPSLSMAKHSKLLTTYKLSKPWDGVLETWSK